MPAMSVHGMSGSWASSSGLMDLTASPISISRTRTASKTRPSAPLVLSARHQPELDDYVERGALRVVLELRRDHPAYCPGRQARGVETLSGGPTKLSSPTRAAAPRASAS
jgi:hypothetical protein